MNHSIKLRLGTCRRARANTHTHTHLGQPLPRGIRVSLLKISINNDTGHPWRLGHPPSPPSSRKYKISETSTKIKNQEAFWTFGSAPGNISKSSESASKACTNWIGSPCIPEAAVLRELPYCATFCLFCSVGSIHGRVCEQHPSEQHCGAMMQTVRSVVESLCLSSRPLSALSKISVASFTWPLSSNCLAQIQGSHPLPKPPLGDEN